MSKQRAYNYIFWSLVCLFYIISLSLSYQRIYLAQDYPIFYTEEEIPDVLEPVNELINFNN
jgi:hypothetical protein